MRKYIFKIVTIFLFIVFQNSIGANVFSVTKNIGVERELEHAESTDNLVQVRLTLTPPTPRLSDTIILRLEIIADSTIKTELPDFGDSIGTLKILETNEEINSVSAGKEQKTLVIKTIPTQAGVTPIWSIPITYYNRQSNSTESKKIVALQMTSVEITSDITPESASLDAVSLVYELFLIEENWLFWTITLAVLGLTAAIILIVWYRNQKKKSEPELKLSPQEIALKHIAELIEERLHEIDVKQFFVELSGIVRWYIEQQTSIRAPELTTEEFLKEVAQNRRVRNAISDELANRLKLFLESADMVKFAKFKPTQEEILQGIKYAQVFIVEWNNSINTEQF
jgi:F0F1-type ATP synthase membrane subunit a